VQISNSSILLIIIISSWLELLFTMEQLIVVTTILTSKSKSISQNRSDGSNLTIFGSENSKKMTWQTNATAVKKL
jgi:hypothetical protein